jgi:hypothetical protein
MTKGGACPDCIMIPEVIWLTANKYLSRSTLIGRGRPDFLYGEGRIKGYLQFALEMPAPQDDQIASELLVDLHSLAG